MTVADYEWQKKPRSVNIKACFLCVSMEISFLNEQLQESKPVKGSDRRCNSRIIRISNKQNNICLLSLWRYRTGTLLISSSFATVFALSPWIIKSLHQVAWDNSPLSSQKLVYYREPKHQRRRPLQIRYLKKKSEFALPQSNFIALIPSCLIRQTFFFFARARARVHSPY